MPWHTCKNRREGREYTNVRTSYKKKKEGQEHMVEGNRRMHASQTNVQKVCR